MTDNRPCCTNAIIERKVQYLMKKVTNSEKSQLMVCERSTGPTTVQVLLKKEPIDNADYFT